ncbi:MAG TPA: hypothetical protein VGC36_08475, partial [Rhizomicrobium sp.]
MPALAIVSIATASVAEAKPRNAHKPSMSAQVTCSQQGCSDNPAAQAGATRQRAQARREPAATQIADANGNGTIVGGRPSNCPHRFCGCEASLYVFGEIRGELNLAANWARKFPRTAPAAGMVAARSGHVMVLMSHASGDE